MMFEQFFDMFIKVTQLLIIPFVILIYKYAKRQITTANDITDLKIYVKAICKEMNIYCTLKDG